MDQAESLKITYSFELSAQRKREFTVTLDPQTLLYEKKAGTAPAWTALEVGQCTHCPLKPEKTPHCPIALNIADLFEAFKDEVSYSNARVTVRVAERTYVKEIPLQQGLFGIFGIIMATSGCPVMNFLKPMARFHLPFSSFEETTVRIVSMYLMGQYFKHKRGETPDWDLKDLDRRYLDVQKVNQGMIKRLSQIPRTGDANANSVTILDSFAKLLSMSLQRDLHKFESLFLDV